MRALGCLAVAASVIVLPGLSCDLARLESHSRKDAQSIRERARTVLSARSESTTRLRHLAELFDEAGPGHLDVLVDEFQAASPYLRPADLEQLAVWWTEFAPNQAIAAPMGSPTLNPVFWKVEVLRSWSERDPHSARDAWAGEPCLGATDPCLLALVDGWYSSDKDGVWRFVEGLPSEFTRQSAMDVLAARLIVDVGADGAARFAEALPEDGERRFKLHFYRRLASALAMRDVEAARAWADKHSGGPFGDGLVRRVAARWILRDAPAAMDWLLSRPSGSQRDEGVRAACHRWVQHDRAAALDWLQDVKDLKALQPGLSIFALARASDDPEAAVAIVERISDPGQREATLIAVIRGWLSRSPSEAEAWIQASGVDRALEAKIRIDTAPISPKGKAG